MMMNKELIKNEIVENKKGIGTIFVLGLLLLLPLTLVNAATAPSLGAADSFAVLAGSTVTNTGSSVIKGDVGVSPATSVTGFPPGTVVLPGTIHLGDAMAVDAQTALTTAYDNAAGQVPTATVSTHLGGQTLTPGVYNELSGTFEITGTLTLDGGGNPNAVFIFQAASTLTTAADSVVSLINRAQAGNVFWKVSSSATIGARTIFVGNILALTSITVGSGATVDGRLLARNGAVTLDSNTITPQYQVTFKQTSSGVAPKVTYHIDSGSDVQGTVEFSVWVDSGSSIAYSYESPVAGAAGTQYVLTGTSPASPQTVSAAFDVTGTYKTQYQLTVTTAYGVVTSAEWFDAESTAHASLVAGTVAGAAGTQYVFTSWSGDASGSDFSSSSAVTMNVAKSVTANWQTQCYIAVNADGHGSPTQSSQWVPAGSSFSVSVTSPESAGVGHQWVVDGPSTQSIADVEATQTLTFSWAEQYYLTVSTNFGSVSLGNGWHDVGSTVAISASAPAAGSGEQYVWNGWTGSGSGSYSGTDNPATNAVTMNAPITEAASWTHQFYITVTSTHDTPTTSAWVNAGADFAVSVTIPDVVSPGHQWVCTGYSVDAGSSTPGTSYTFANVHAAHAIAFSWKEQFYITVTSGHDTPSSSQWMDQGDSLTVSVVSPADESDGTRYRCIGYTLDSNPSVTDGSTSYAFTDVQAAHSIGFNWIAQYRLTVSSAHDSPSPGVGDHWYDAGTHIDASVTSPVDESGGTRCRCTDYSGTGSVSSGSGTSVGFNIGAPSTLTWNWIAQYQVTFSQSDVGVDFAGMVVTVNGTGYARGGTSFWADSGDVYTFSYASPLVVTATAKQYVLIGVDASSPLTVSGATTVTGSYKVHLEGIVLAPLSSTNPLGTSHTVTATVADTGDPVVGSSVTFRVVSGPNAGLTSSVLTNSSGQASFTYTSSLPSTDTIEASFVNSQGATVTSNQVTKTWTSESPPKPVGGKISPIDTLSVLSVLLSQYSAVMVLLIILLVPLGFLLVKKRKRF